MRTITFSALVAILLAPSVAVAGPVAGSAGIDWTGFYLGVNGGYDFGSFDVLTHSSVPKLDGITRDFTANGGLLGATGGVDTQVGNLVLGIEGDLDWTKISGVADPIKPDASPASVLTTNIDWLATLRGRAGMTAGNALLFATAGLSAGGVSGTITNFPSGNSVTSIGGTQYGTVIGAGIEASLAPHLTGKLEVLRVDLGTATYQLPPVMTADAHPVANIIQFSLNYRF